MKITTKLLSLALIIGISISLSGCFWIKNNNKPSGNTPGGNTQGGNTSSGDYIYTNGSKLQIVIPSDDALAFNLGMQINEAIAFNTGCEAVLVNDAKEASEHEIVIGNASREITKTAINRLERVDLNSEYETKYIAYSDGKSVSLMFEDDIFDINSSAYKVVEQFINDYIEKNQTLTLKKGTVFSGTTDYVEYQKALDEKQREEEWDNLLIELGGNEQAQQTVQSFKNYYSLFSSDVVTWLANLYDTETGAFYYSNSGRDTEGFGSDIESTSQVFAFLSTTGVVDCIGGINNLPDDMKNTLGQWVKSLQDPNGFFYHPQWSKAMIDNKLSRRGRDLNQALSLLSLTGFKPTYSVNGVEGDYTLIDGTKVDSKGEPIASESSLTGRFIYDSPVTAVSKVIAVSSVTASHLRDDVSFRAYLNSLNIRTNSYAAGNTLAAQASQIKARDAELKKEGASYTLTGILEEFLYNNQNPETGTWDWTGGNTGTSSGQGRLEGNNGVLKIVALYNDLGIEFPRPELAIDNAIKIVLLGEDETVHVCDTYNTWFAIDEIFQNLRAFSNDAEAQIAAIRADMLKNAPTLIDNTRKRLAEHMKQDGSFSYYKNETSAESQGVPVALGHQNEGDVNATYICIGGTTSHMFRALGLTDVKLFGKTEYCVFYSTIYDLGDIIKDPVPDPEPITFEEYDPEDAAEEIDTTSCKSDGKFMVITDPRNKEEKVYLIDAKNTGGDSIKMYPTATGVSCYIFETDIMVESADNTIVAQIKMDNAYMLALSIKDGKVYLNDASSTSASVSYNQTLGIEKNLGEWFNLRIEYYPGTHYTVRAVIYINEKPVVISDNYYDRNGSKLNGTGQPSDDFAFMEFICFSDANVKMMIDNVLVMKSNDEYSSSNYDHSNLLFDSDPPVLDEIVYDFENGEIPEDFNITSGNVSVNENQLYVTAEAGSALEFAIPENKRTVKATATVFEAIMNFSASDVGAKLELTLTDDSGNAIARFRLEVIEEGAKKYVTLIEAPRGADGRVFHTVKVPIEGSFKLSFEYYKSQSAVIIILNDMPVDITNKLCNGASEYASSKLVFTNIGDSALNFSIDDIKLESVIKNYDDIVKSDINGFIYDFESGIPAEVETVGNVKTTEKEENSRITLGGKNSSFAIPLNNRGFAMKVLMTEFEIELGNKEGECVTVSVLAKDGATILEYVLTIKDGKLYIHESTEEGILPSDVFVTAGKNIKITLDYFTTENVAHIYIDGVAVLASYAVYADGRGHLTPDRLMVEYTDGSSSVSLDNIKFETFTKEYKKLVIQTLEMGTGENFNEYKDDSLVYDDLESFTDINANPVYRPDGYPSANKENDLNAHSAHIQILEDGNKVLVLRDQISAEGAGTLPSLHFVPFRVDPSQITYVFESDIRFSSLSSSARVETGRKAFGFNIGNISTTATLKSMDPFGRDYGSSVDMVVNSEGGVNEYKLHGMSLEADRWYNIKITLNPTTGRYRVYINGEEIYSVIYADSTEVTGFRVAINKTVGGLMSVQFDNTYFGTYDGSGEPEDPELPDTPDVPDIPDNPDMPNLPTETAPGDGKYFNENKSDSLVYDDKTDFAEINADPVYRAGDGSVSGGNSENHEQASVDIIGEGDKILAFRQQESPTSISGATPSPTIHFRLFKNDTNYSAYVFESDIWLTSAVGGANLSNGRYVFVFDFGNSYAASANPGGNADTSYMRSDTIYDNKGTSGLAMIVENGAVIGYTLHGKALDVEAWYNLRITFNTETKTYKVYINSELIYSEKIESITGVTGMTIGINKACGGLLGINFDNTYCGTYDASGEVDEPDTPDIPDTPVDPPKPPVVDEPDEEDYPGKDESIEDGYIVDAGGWA